MNNSLILRMKGMKTFMCKYCEQNKRFDWTTYTEVRIEDSKLVVYSMVGEDVEKDEIDIKFCPKCGESLK